MTGPALNEPVIIVEDVSRAIVEHARGAPESCKVLEHVQGGRCMRWFQVPSKSTRMCRVVEERQVGLLPGDASNQPHTPAAVAACSQIRPVPGIWQLRYSTCCAEHQIASSSKIAQTLACEPFLSQEHHAETRTELQHATRAHRAYDRSEASAHFPECCRAEPSPDLNSSDAGRVRINSPAI